MTHLFLAVVSSLYDPLAMKWRVKNTCTTCALHGSCQTWPLQVQLAKRSLAFRHSTLWTLFCCVGWQPGVWRRTCVAGQGVNDAHTGAQWSQRSSD